MQTGDILIGRRFSGDAVQQMILAGSLASHAAMVVQDGTSGIWYVIDCPSDMGLLNRGAVRKTGLDEWLGMAMAEDFEVVWLPLDKKLRTFGDLNENQLNLWFN